jgi:hypothetical protein
MIIFLMAYQSRLHIDLMEQIFINTLQINKQQLFRLMIKNLNHLININIINLLIFKFIPYTKQIIFV